MSPDIRTTGDTSGRGIFRPSKPMITCNTEDYGASTSKVVSGRRLIGLQIMFGDAFQELPFSRSYDPNRIEWVHYKFSEIWHHHSIAAILHCRCWELHLGAGNSQMG